MKRKPAMGLSDFRFIAPLRLCAEKVIFSMFYPFFAALK